MSSPDTREHPVPHGRADVWPGSAAPAAESGGCAVSFLFPGVGDQYPQMARGLYESEPVFRAGVDRCAEVLRPHLGLDLREALYPGDGAGADGPGSGEPDLRRMLGRGGTDPGEESPAFHRTELAHPAVFVVEYALARLWMENGVVPECMIGHSLGEYVAATVAGVFALEDALALVAARARLIEALPPGAMLAVPLGPEPLRPLLGEGAALAAVNAPGLCTVSGAPEAVAALEGALAERGVSTRRLRASHAFHSAAMQPVAERLAERVRGMELRAPSIPFLSNVTGTWITAEEAADPEYWASHLTRTVRFADGIGEALRTPGRVFLEVGPGRTLGTFALHAGAPEASVLASLRHAYTRRSDAAFFLQTLGRLRASGAPLPPRATPRTRTERAVAEAWGEVLDVRDVGAHDDFFALGGHSLLAMQILTRLRDALGVELSLREILEAPTVAGVAARVDAARAAGAHSGPSVLGTAPRDRLLPLSFPQQRLWFLEQLGAGSVYNVPRQVRLRGGLDVATLRRALDRIVARHEALRTTFVAGDGEPWQRIAPAEGSGFPLVEHDLTRHAHAEPELRRLVSAEADTPFDLERGPLVRGRLVRLAADDHVLLVTMHHIVSDGWSMEVMAAELDVLYAAYLRGEGDPLPPLPVQYADYVAWHRRWVEEEVAEKQGAYWRDALAGAPDVLQLPLDRARPAQQDFAGASVALELDGDLVSALKALGRRHGATLYMTLLAGWAAVLGRLSGHEDVVVGTPTANRGRREIEGLIGFFVNTLALRVDLSGAPTVAELLARVKARALEAQRHQDIPFDLVVERVQPARSLAHSPVFQVMFAWQNVRRSRLGLPGLSPAFLERPTQATAKVDLLLSLQEVGGRIVGGMEYATSLFERATVERYLGYLRRVLEGMAADDGREVRRLDLLPDAERRQVVEEWNRTEAEYPADACVHQLFEAQVERTPDAVAVVFGDESLTYGELNARANRLAHHLRERGVGPDTRVAVCVERGLEMLTGLLAVLKAGGGYVPLDPAYPVERLRFALEDSAPVALLAQRSLAGLFAGIDLPVIELDAGAPAWAAHPRTNPDGAGLRPDHLAYVIYTSGSTGQPKGVMVEHRNVVRLFSATRAWFHFDASDVWTLFHSFAFDFSVWETWGALLSGGRLVVVARDTARSPADFYRLVCRERVTVLNQTPSAFRQFMAAQAAGGGEHGLRHVIFGGEALEVATLKPWFERNDDRRTRLINMYGITETTVHVTYRPIERADAERVGASPIGRRIPDLRTYILDAAGEPVPLGVAGELYVGGAGVARGYLNRPELTAERFVEDRFRGEPGARMYRTGDLGRWRADGTIEYLGRNDHQVKIRGFRIELGEVEARLAEHAAVREAVVLAREDAPGDRRLVAYYVGAAVDVETLRAHLSERLPEYMVPAAYVALATLPLTPNGKVDRRALPAPEGDAYARRGYEAPVDGTEEALAELWSEVLGVERVGRWDHFFELGGHSFLAVKLTARMRRRGLHAEVQALFTTPTLAELAAVVRGESYEVEVPPNGIPTPCDAITPEMLPLVELSPAEIEGIVAGVAGGARNVQDVYPLAPLQDGMLFHHLMTTEGDPYLLLGLSSFQGRERLDAYLGALQAVIDRHDILRTAVVWEGLPEPVQVVWREAPLEVEEVEVDAAGGGVEEQLYARFDPRRHRLDLGRAPLMRACVARDAARDRWLLLLLQHHLVMDHTTLEALEDEVEAHLLGRGDELPAPLPFRNYVAQARLGVSRAEHEAYFRQLLGDVDEPTAPFGLLDARRDGSGIDEARLPVDAALAGRLRERARKLGVSAASICHVAWAQVLARVSDRDDVVFGTLLFGRMQGGEGADRVLGPFINTLPVRVRVGPEGVEAGVRGTHRQLAELLRHEHASLALAQRCSGVEAPAPLFTALLNYRHGRSEARRPEVRRAWEGIERAPLEERTNYPVTLSVDDWGGSFGLKAQVPASVGPERVCAMMHTALERLVEALEEAPGRAVRHVDVLPEAERRQVVEAWNATEAEYPGHVCVHELFEAQAERTPDAVAVAFDGGELTYAELNRRANQLAHFLAERGAGPDVRVALCLERGPEMLVGVLGVLKAGGAYVPLDAAYPEDRLRYMLRDSAPAVLLTQGSLAGRLGGLDVPVVALDADASALAIRPGTNPDRSGLALEHLAYVIYTSGSTGRPKGVEVPHRGLTNYVWYARSRYVGEGPGTFPLHSSLAFDLTVTSIYVPLTTGGSVVIARKEDGDRSIARVLEEDRADVVKLTPSHLALLAQRDLEGLRLSRLVVGGEDLTAPLARAIRDASAGRLEIFNEYGPTEATVGCVVHPFDPERDLDGSVPIGGPIANTRAYVLDAAGEPVPSGVAGELYVGGVQVARGYRNRPGLTAERFLPDPFGGEPGARLYRTGDLVRWRGDGTLEFLGRRDAQVKVRGYRIEPGEIEARLAEHAAVREAVVVVREDVPGDRRLVAYYVGAGGPVQVDALRSHLGERLPEHMVPAAYVALERLPLTPNGKVDRRALPAPEGDAYTRRGYEAPASAAEVALAEIWSNVLGVEGVGRWAHFFELGGHSLLAVQVISRVRQVLEVEVELGEVFDRPVLADFARVVESAGRAELPPIEPVDRCGRLALSFAQQRLWFLEQLGGLRTAYHVCRRLRLRGELDRAALTRTLDRIVARHEALRTTFRVVDGEPEQRIGSADETGFRLVEHDLGEHPAADPERLIAEEERAPFDLERGPLVRGRLIRLAADDHVLVLTMHHIVSDGWSTGVLTDELSALYGAFHRGEPDPLPPLPVQYADYAAWQRRWVEEEVLEAQAAYWTDALAGAPELLELPTDHARPVRQDHAGASVRVELDEALTAGLRALSQRHGTTLFMTLLAGWAAVLGRLSGQEDVVVGTPTANRGRPEIEGLIGFFANTLALRVDLSGAPTVAELLARVKARALEAQQNQDIPFEQVVERVQPVRSLAHNPVFQVMFAWQNAPGGSLELPGLELAPVQGGSQGAAKFDLSLALQEAGGRIVGGLTYATALFETATAERCAGYLRRVLEGMAEEEGRRVDRLRLLSPAERTRVVEEWNRTEAEDPGQRCVHELFEAQAERNPDAVAVIQEDRALTYGELNRRANRLAHHLIARGVGPDVRVGVCLERGPELVAGLLGVLKAGGAYVPLDPEYPRDRLRYTLTDSEPAVLLTQESLQGRLADLDAGLPVVRLDGASPEWAECPATNPDRGALGPRHLAYVIYTSGSTGRPKGVAVEHRNLVNLVGWHCRAFALEAGRRSSSVAGLGFDATAWEVWPPLCAGAALSMPGNARDPMALLEWWARQELDVSFLPTPLAEAAFTHGIINASLRTLLVGGDRLHAVPADPPPFALVNNYGPTETTVVATSGEVGGAAKPHIGRPIANARVYVLDGQGEPVPVGVVGELYVGGAGVARGYLGRPELTAGRFVPDAFGGGAGGRLYRTGDLCRWLADGTLDFVGRNDAQVKVRGHRIEPGEIEARLAEHPQVRGAAVVAREDSPGDGRLVAYYVGDPAVDAETLRSHLGERLPEYMVPAAYVRLEALPLTPNGKLDRRALPEPEGDSYARRGYEAPASETEEALAEIWSEVLGVERVGRHDHFFELGGHSLLASRLALRIRQRLEVDIALGDVFERPVLSELARQVVDAQLAQFDPIDIAHLAALLRAVPVE